jgi:hypothetical protein
VVNLNEVRPWGLAEPEDMKQATTAEPKWVEALPNEGAGHLQPLSKPARAIEWEDDYPAPPPLPENLAPARPAVPVAQELSPEEEVKETPAEREIDV